MPRFCRERAREVLVVVGDHVAAVFAVCALLFVGLPVIALAGWYAGPLSAVVLGPVVGKVWCVVFGGPVCEVIEYWTVSPELRRFGSRMNRGL